MGSTSHYRVLGGESKCTGRKHVYLPILYMRRSMRRPRSYTGLMYALDSSKSQDAQHGNAYSLNGTTAEVGMICKK